MRSGQQPQQKPIADWFKTRTVDHCYRLSYWSALKKIKDYLLEISEDEIYKEENKAAVMWWQPEN